MSRVARKDSVGMLNPSNSQPEARNEAAEFVQDLDDIEALANWAEEEGATRMTLEVTW